MTKSEDVRKDTFVLVEGCGKHHFPQSTLFPSSRWKAPLGVITTDYVRNTAPATDQNAVPLRNKFYTTSRSTFPGLNDNYDANKIHIIHMRLLRQNLWLSTEQFHFYVKNV